MTTTIRRIRPIIESGPDACASLLDEVAQAPTRQAEDRIPPIGGAVAWVTDGERYGAELCTGEVRWMVADEIPSNIVGWEG